LILKSGEYLRNNLGQQDGEVVWPEDKQDWRPTGKNFQDLREAGQQQCYSEFQLTPANVFMSCCRIIGSQIIDLSYRPNIL
jgi:hypothetical protein